MKKLALPLVASVCLSTAVQADNLQGNSSQWSLGLGVASMGSPYKGMSTDTEAVPLLEFDNQYFFVQGTRIGYKLYEGGGYYVNLIGEQGKHSFDNSDSDALRGLKNRRNSFNAGVSAGMHTDNGHHFRLDVLTDASKTHKGTYADMSYGYMFAAPDYRWTITPEVGVHYFDDNYADYYFGVSREEEARTGVARYNAGGEINPYLKLTSSYNLNQRLSLIAQVNYTRLGDRISDSSMVDDSHVLSAMGGVVYRF